ncbi:MAG: major capsid family protein [Waterburya sp.]
MSFRNDAIGQAGVFLSRQLEQRLPKIYEKRYPALKFSNGTLLPSAAELEAGADSVVEEIMETIGEAGEASADQIDDIPLADAGITEFKYPVMVKPIAIRYSVRELQASIKGNRNIRGMRELAARRAIEESANKIAAYGDKKTGAVGLLNDLNVPVNNSSFDPYTATQDQLIDFLTGEVSKVIVSSKLTEEPNTMLVPVKLHELITNKRIPDSPLTVKKFILENNPYITDIVPCNEVAAAELEANGVETAGTNKDSILIYPRNPEVVQRLFEPLATMEPQLRGMNFVVIMYYATTGAIWHYPGSAIRVKVAKG